MMPENGQERVVSGCREAVKRCQTLDHRMKSERNMDNEGELKLFLMELAGVK